MECTVCSSQMRNLSDTKLYWLSRCPKCGFLTADLTPGVGAEIGGIETLRRRNFSAIIDLISTYQNVNTISALEVGCSRGWFLDEARDRGLKCVAVEPDTSAATETQKRGHTVYNGLFPAVLSEQPNKFDLIIFNDVFEHLPDIRSAKASISDFLNPQGLLVLNLPDSNGVLYKAAEAFSYLGWYEPLERLWQKDLVSPHLSYFNRQNIGLFFTEDSHFSLLYADRLESMKVTGLWTRLRSGGQSVPISAFLYIPLVVTALLAHFLPSDIQLLVFKKIV